MTGQTLRFYLSNCELPPLDLGECEVQLPPIGHKSHCNRLKVRPEEWRRLESIHLLPANISSAVQTWTYENVTDEEPIDMRKILKQGRKLSLPCISVIETLSYCLVPPDSVASLSMWMQCLPLQTVENTFHLLHPEFSHWKFKLVDDGQDNDKELMQYFEWCERGLSVEGGQNRTRSDPSLIVAFQVPWVLSDQDIEEFTQCRSFPRFRQAGYAFPTSLDSHHRVWAKLWDLCARRNTRWFVLTSYNQWVFGGFSEGWSSGFITGVYPHWSTQPSIAEMLAFWVVSSMQIPGSATLPKVIEPLGYQIGSTLIPASAPVGDFEIPSESESNWEGKSDTIGTSADVYSQISEGDSVDSMATVRAQNLSHMHEPRIQQWIANTNPELPHATVRQPALTAQTVLPNTTRRTAGAWLF